MMAAQQIVRIMSHAKKPKVKIEPEDDDLNVTCELCSKIFANEVAIRNHLRMEHSGVVVDLVGWIETAKQKQASEVRIKSEPICDDPVVAKKTAEIVSNMRPANIMSLASTDVNYIIIKAEDIDKINMEKIRRRKNRNDSSGEESPTKKAYQKKEKPVVPITGPFECLQPSTSVADGTCHQIFFSCCEYSMHYRDEHTRRRKAIKCQVCEKLLAAPNGEEPTSPYPCQVCGLGFNSNKELTKHTNTAHFKLKPFVCDICHKRFTQQGGVQQHMRMHTGDRPFPCPFCSKAFTQKSGLDQHMRTHTRVKPYRCVICGKNFIQSVHLKQHMRTHTNITPFQCVICEKRFKQSSHLNYHLRNHNENNMTEEQKKKYQDLIGMIRDNDEEPQVILEEDSQQIVIEQEDVGDVILEHNEQVVQDNGEYILSDMGNDKWSVKIVS